MGVLAPQNIQPCTLSYLGLVDDGYEGFYCNRLICLDSFLSFKEVQFLINFDFIACHLSVSL